MSDITQPKANGNGADHDEQASITPSTSIFDDLDALRLDPAESLAETVEHLSHVPVRKQSKQEFFRTHSAGKMRLTGTIFTDTEDKDEAYFVPPLFRQYLLGHLKSVILTACVSVQGVTFLWPVALPREDGGSFRGWGESARQAAEIARGCWIRIQSDKALGAYRIIKAEGHSAEPKWPRLNFEELLKIAFAGRIVDAADHPIIRKLRGIS